MPDRKALVVVPTYNEKDNIGTIISKIFDQDVSRYVSAMEILVVDDNSPDGTAALVKNIRETNSAVHLLERPAKQGLGKAYVAGFTFALQHDYDYILEMDADLSHDPVYLPDFFEKIQSSDLVIGSRYLHGVNVINWPLSRLLISYFGNLYARMVTGFPVRDATSGYKCFRASVLRQIDLTKVSASGYSFQIEMNYRIWKLGFKLCETSIIFYDRQLGQSKMSANIVKEGLLLVWKLRIKAMFGQL